jgi:hypothetical protein
MPSTVAPSEVMLATIASAMPAAIIEYSMAVAPEAPRQKRIKDAFMGPSPGPLTAGFVIDPGYELVNAKRQFSPTA